MKINGKEIKFSFDNPQKEGIFIWQNSLGVEVIKVLLYPASNDYGVYIGPYYGVPQFRGRNIEALKGSFVEIEGAFGI
jgi:hypothetical protein